VKKSDKVQESESHDFFGATSLVKAALSRSSKYQQLVDTDEEKEKKPQITESRVKVDSSSSYAEDDHPGGQSIEKTADFHYQELDDEYGSRPVAIKSNQETVNRRPPARKESDNAPNSNNADPIVGHEYGVRPLLDDDELEDDDHGGHHHDDRDIHDNSTPSSSTMSPLAGSSPAMSPTSDPFVSAPYRRKPSRKKRPSSAVQNRPSKLVPESTDIFSKAPFKTAYLSKTQHTIGSPLLDSNNASPDMKDPFGNAPYSRKSVSSNDNTKQLVSSVITTTSPIEQTYIYDNPVTQPSIEQNLIFSNLNTESTVTTETNFVPFSTSVPLSNTVSTSDMFGSVPFQTMMTKPSSVKEDSKKVKAGTFTSTPAKPNKSKSQNYHPLSDNEGDSDDHIESTYLRKCQQQQASLIVNIDSGKEDEDFDDEDCELNSSSSSKHSRSKVRGRSSPRETVGFSNMSFNDDDDDEGQQPQHSTDQSSNSLHISSIRHPAFIKEPKYAVAISSTEAIKANSSGSYDTFTWPRKHKKSMATNEPFSSKKKIDILSK
jgi:hypothetical protein